MLRSCLRAGALLYVVGLFLVKGAVRELRLWLLGASPSSAQRARAKAAHRAARELLRIFDFQVAWNQTPMSASRFIVANHLSFWDALILAARFPCVFVTSCEVRDTAFVGWIARLSGSLFVERRSASQLRREIDELAIAATHGLPIVFFPEGTSTSGEDVLPFKRSLFLAAERARSGVQPLVFNYSGFNGEPLSRGNRDQVFYYGSISIGLQLWRALRFREVRVDVDTLPVLPVAPASELAREAYKSIVGAFRRVTL